MGAIRVFHAHQKDTWSLDFVLSTGKRVAVERLPVGFTFGTIAAQTEVVDKLKDGLNGMKQKLVELKSKRSELSPSQTSLRSWVSGRDQMRWPSLPREPRAWPPGLPPSSMLLR